MTLMKCLLIVFIVVLVFAIFWQPNTDAMPVLDAATLMLGQIDGITIAKSAVSVSRDDGAGHKVYAITLKCDWTDATGTPSSGTWYVTKLYRSGKAVSDLYAEFLADFQKEIDSYNDMKTIYDHAQLDAIVTNLQANLSY
jgi:hypothetical protein